MCVIFPTYISIIPTYRPVQPYTSSTHLCDQQEPVHPPKRSSCSREMIAAAFSHPGASSSTPRTPSMLVWPFSGQPGRGITFQEHQEKNLSLVQDAGGGGGHRALHAECSRQAAWVPATERHSEFRSQLRVNAQSTKCITLCKNQFLCWSQRGEQSYSNQDQFSPSRVFTREKGL